MKRSFSPVLGIMICLLLWQIGIQLQSSLSWGHESFQLTEWLIDYSGGFVRRGLTGSLIRIISETTGMLANRVAILWSTICYLILAIWFLRRSTGTFPVILILSCVVIGFPAYQDCIPRKDCLGLLLLLGCLRVENSRMARPLAFAVINLLAGTAILCHEAFLFYSLPALVLFTRREGPPFSALQFFRRSLALLPAAVCFVIASIHHGTPAIAEAVNDSWLPLWRVIDPTNANLETPSAAIEALGWTSGQGLSIAGHMLTSGFYQPAAWAMVFVVSFALMVLFTDRDASPSLEIKIRVAAILLAQLAFISPLFLLGFDYGRWLFLWVASSIMLHTLHRRAPRWLESAVAGIFEKAKVERIIAWLPAKDWYLLCFGVPVCWNIHNFLAASPLVRHLQFLWQR
jgi:hypothetical protein